MTLVAKYQNQLFDYLCENPNYVQLKILNQIFRAILPFNCPHKIEIKEILSLSVESKLPFIKANLNHVKTIHACAQATVGEFSAGVLLIKLCGMSKYRLIMEKMDVQYHYQAKTDLRAVASIGKKSEEKLMKELEENGLSSISLSTKLFDKDNNHVSTVKTKWQLKKWKLVRFKNF